MEENKPKTEKEIIDLILREKKEYEQTTNDYRTEIKDIYDAYMGKMDQVVKTPYKNQETIPKLRTEVAYIKPFIFSGTPIFEVHGVGAEDEMISSILEKIVNWRLSTIKNSYDKIEDWVHQAVTFGTSILKVVWRFETKKNEDGTETPISDEPDFEVPNILDVYYNPIVSAIDNQPSIICRSVLPLDQVRRNAAYSFTDSLGKLNREKVESKKIFGGNNYNSTQQFGTDGIDTATVGEGLVDVYERYTKDKIQTIADGKEQLLLRDTNNPYGFINMVKFVFEKNTIPNRFNGLGVGHNTLGLGVLYFRLMNQTLDNVALTNNPMFLFKKGANIDKKQLVAKPGGGISVDAADDSLSNTIQPLIFPDIKQGAVEVLRTLDDEHKRASGANDLVQGSVSNKTLGQDNLAQSNSTNRFELIVRRFKEAIAEVGNMLIQMEIQNIQSSDAPVLRIFPKELRENIYQILISEAKNVKFNVSVRGETNISKNKDLQSRRLIDLFNLSGGFLTDREKRAFLRRIAERQGEDNVDEIIATNNPIADDMENQALDERMLPEVGAEDRTQA